MVYRLTSSKAIVRKIMRDLKPPGDNWIDDSIEWIGEALEHIGATPQLVQKGKVLNVVDYKVLLPSDLYYINQVAINNVISPTITNELTELVAQLAALNAQVVSDPNDKIAYNYQLREINARIGVLENLYLAADNTLSPLQYGTSTFPAGIHCDNCVNQFIKCKETYIVDGGYIKTSFKEGPICLSYTAFPLDEDCYPMVPDDISYKEAMFWYVYKQMMLGGYVPSMNGIDYNFADQKWRYYCTQARNAANYPSIDKYESFLNQWVRLVPNINRHSTGFENLNTRENLDRGRYNNYGTL